MRSFLAVLFFHVCICCQLKDYLACVVQLSSQKVDFEINPLDVIFNVTSEAKLMHTCRVYSRVFPCFEQRVAECGTSLEKLQLERGKRFHTYLCSPFSLQRQKLFLQNSQCIQSVLKGPQTANCQLNGAYMEKIKSCKNKCVKGVCASKIKLSQISICLIDRIKSKCGSDASTLFKEAQQVLTNSEYPIQCEYETVENEEKLRKGIPSESIKPTTLKATTLVTVYPPKNDGVVTRTSLPIVRRTDPNSKIRARPNTPLTTIPIMKTVYINNKGQVVPMRNATIDNSTKKTSTKTPMVIKNNPTRKFLPNPYTKAPPTIKNEPVRTTRTTSSIHNYTPWVYKPSEMTAASQQNVKNVQTVSSTPPTAFKLQLPREQTSAKPFKVEINWLDDPIQQNDQNSMSDVDVNGNISPWYLKTTPQLRPQEEQEQQTTQPTRTTNLIANHLAQAQSLNLTEISQQANNYFSAALNAFAETKKEMGNNDTWRTIIDAVAPTIHKVSPDIIPRIREEINRIQPN